MRIPALLVVALAAALGSCRNPTPSDFTGRPKKVLAEKKPVRPELAAPLPGAGTQGFCSSCNMDVLQGHDCGRTVPCRHCGREQGAEHVHEIRRECEACRRIDLERHVCNDSRSCGWCRADSRGFIAEHVCANCGRVTKVVGVVGVTAYCPECRLEVGAGHLHGRTRFCLTCSREAGEGHVHQATRYCGECGSEAAIDHVHGRTKFCRACGWDAGPGHRHGETVWCAMCGSEEPWPHGFHRER